jgi:di/tricarboxylate transporter
VLVVDSPALVRRQAVPLGLGAREALAVLGAMVVLLATGAVPPVAAGLLAAGALILLRVLTVEQAYRANSWTTVVLVAGMLPLSTAMEESGAAKSLADGLVDVVGDAGPYALLVGLVLLVFALGQLISNMATALIVIPIALSAAQDMDVSAKPVPMTVSVSAAAAFPHTSRDSGEPDGDGSRRLPVRRLLEARPAVPRSLRRRRRAARSGLLEFLSQAVDLKCCQ